MESSAEVVWKEETKSSVSKKCVQEMSAISVQTQSSSSSSTLALDKTKSVLSILDPAGGNIVANEMATDVILLSSPIITSPILPEERGNEAAINTTSHQNEFSLVKLKDEQGNEIGDMVQKKQQQQSVQASSFVTSNDNGSKSNSSVTQLSSSATSLVAKAETSSSVSCSSSYSTSSAKKQEIVSSSTRSLSSSIKSAQSIEKVIKSSTAVVQDLEF